MASGEIRLSSMTMRRMPVLAQSGDPLDPNNVFCNACGVVWGDGNGGQINSSAGVTVTTTQNQSNGSDTASASFTALGAGAAMADIRYGELFLGTPNGRIYTRAWANGVGRTVSIGALAESFGWAGLAVSTAFDYDSLQNGDIDQTQFNVNLGLGTAGMFNPAGAILLSPYIFINSTYPGGLGQWMLDNPEAMMPIAAGYMGN